MILIGYRHGLRASELCDLQWSQIELATGRLHVRRAKNGSPSVHPMQGVLLRRADDGPCLILMTQRRGAIFLTQVTGRLILRFQKMMVV